MAVAEGRRKRGGRLTTALTLVGALLAWQALAVVWAGPAFAQACDFSAGVWTITLPDDGDEVWMQQTAAGQITPEVNGGAVVCTGGISLVSNTTAINIIGGAGSQWVGIAMYDDAAPPESIGWGTINWTVNLGSGTGDILFIDNSDGDAGLNLVLGANGIDLDDDGDLDVSVANVEVFEIVGSDGEDDTISGAGSAATGGPFPIGIEPVDTGVPFGTWGGIYALAGDDTLVGGSGNDWIEGGAGEDTVAGGLGDDHLDGGAGEDTVDYSGSATPVNVNLAAGLASGEGVDAVVDFEHIIGSAFSDALTGDGGDNTIWPGTGDDTVNGGAGDDTVDYSDSPAAVEVDLGAGTATGSGNDTLSSIENATGSAFADTLVGSTADNELRGGGGNDTLSGMQGDNLLIGGPGVDTVDYAWSANPVVLELNCLGADGSGDHGGTGTDRIMTMENAILTSGDDSFIGNEFPNRVWPNGGQNSLNGDCSDPSASGGDTLDYGMGYDAGVEVNLAGGATANDSAIGFENVFGSPFDDVIVGNDLSNLLAGRGGNDSIRGGGGDDTIRGGPGVDVLRGGPGDDTIRGGAGNDRLIGGAGDDTLRGGAGNDILRGGAGDDELFGGPGNDRLFGGPGVDFGNGGRGRDLCRGVEIMRNCTRF